jgi:hypothetical protein
MIISSDTSTVQLEDRLRELEANLKRLAERLEPTRTRPMNRLTTQISDELLQRIRDYLDQEADLVAVGSDPAQAYEQNAALVLLQSLDFETEAEFQ